MTQEFAQDIANAIQEVATQHGLNEQSIEVDLDSDPRLIFVEGQTEQEGRVELTAAISEELPRIQLLTSDTVSVSYQDEEEEPPSRSIGTEAVFSSEQAEDPGRVVVRSPEELEDVMGQFENILSE